MDEGSDRAVQVSCAGRRESRPAEQADLAIGGLGRNGVGVTNEPRNEGTLRSAVDVLGCAELDDPALVHHGDAGGQGQRFFLVMRDIDRRHFQAAGQFADFEPHFLAQ